MTRIEETRPTMAHDVFISHSSKDKAVADAICAVLEGERIRCWIAPRDITPSDTWASAIEQAIDSCRVFVLVVSSSSSLSADCLRELSLAASRGIPILPVRIEETEPSTDMQHHLNNVHWLDALTEPREREIQVLANRVKSILGMRDVATESRPTAAPMAQGAETGQPWTHSGSRLGDEIVGPDGGAMVWVPAGEFTMGSRRWLAVPDEKPQHHERIMKGLWLGKCEVTNAQYRGFCETSGRPFPSESKQGEDHPVVCVSWEDAQAYCEHHGLRLPTEAEWEYAARGTESLKYPWGNRWDKGKCCNTESRGPGGRTCPVGSLAAGASWCAALDLAGNVWEWCADWYEDCYYRQSPAEDPSGPPHGEYRVLRGGSWVDGPSDCRSAGRNWDSPIARYDFLGFRCCASPE